MDGNNQIFFYLLFIPHMLFALSVHEALHAYSAFLLGDDTAALQGRATLNPIRHIDPMGLIAFFIIHFGWARPVPVNPLRLRHPRRDEMLVSLAGPGSNLMVGLVLLLIIRGMFELELTGSETTRTALAFLFVGAQLNVGLCVFNLIPIPPLDGSHILLGILPIRLSHRIEPYFNYGWLVLLGLILLGRLGGIPFFGIIIGIPMQLFMWGVLGTECFVTIGKVMASFSFF